MSNSTGGYVISVDPYELANRFATQEPLYDDMGFDEPPPESSGSYDLELLQRDADFENIIRPLLDEIPPREADSIELYFIHKKKQADIAEIFGVTQAAISYRLDRGLQRIRFLLSIPRVTQEDLERDLPLVPFKSMDVNILVGMFKTTCQSEVAAQLGLTQGRVRHRFFNAVLLLETKKDDPRFAPYYKIFSSISNKNFNVLRGVVLPQWSGRGGDGCF